MAAVLPLKINAGAIERFVTSTDFIAITEGGTGAVTASGARTALGLAIGTDVVAWDADLDAIAALSSTGIAVRTAANTWAQRTLQAPAAGFTITNPAGVAGDPTFVLANDLAAVEGLSSNGMVARTATDTWTVRTIAGTATRITVSNGDGVSGAPTIDLATLSDGGGGTFLKFTRDSYGRVSGTSSVATADISALVDTRYIRKDADSTVNSTFHISQDDPTSPQHLATKAYVDAVSQGYSGNKTAVRAATTANVTLSGSAPNTLDGVTLALNDDILVKDQSTGAQNGIYTITTLGSGSNGTWTRKVGYDTSAEVTPGIFVFVSEGTANGNNGYTLTTDAPITLNTTALTFTQTSGAGQIVAGNGLLKTGNTIDITTADTTRIVINTDSIDLGQPTIGGSGSGTGFTKVNVDVYGRVISTATATPADIGAQPSDSDLTAIAGLATNGLIARTGTGTMSTRTITAPAAGITVSNGDGVSGNPTLALADDLAAVEGLSSNGIPVRTATSTWTIRSLATASSGRITVTNGDGVSGNPTVDLASGIVTPGTYNSVTVDTYGRVTAGSASASSNLAITLTNNQGSTINIGQVVYSFSADNVRLGIASGSGSKGAIGLVGDTTIANSASGSIITHGVLSATTGQWDAVTGQTGGLTSGALYYLDNATAGAMSTTAPASGWVICIGRALSTTKFLINIGESVKL